LADTATQPGDLATVATSGDYDDLSNKPDLSAFNNISEHANVGAFPATGAADKFYLAQDTGILYRWTGSAYSIISAQLALGETSSTAYRGDRGATAFTHVSATDNPHSVSKAQVGLALVPNVDARARASHTGTQLAATISDFAATVRATVLTGLSTASSAVVVAGDTILVAIGKLQAQVTLRALKNNATFTGTFTFPTGFSGIAKMTSGVLSAITAPTGAIVGTTDAQTVSGKRPQPRTASSTTSASLTPDLATANVYYRTTQTATLTINAPTGTPVIGETIVIYVDSAGAQTLTMNATFIPFGAAFPATTTAGKTLMITAQYNGTDWKTLMAVAQ